MVSIFGQLRRLVPGATDSSSRAFISYAHEDEQAVASLVADLKQEKIDAWFALGKLQAGDHITREVKSAIENARFFLVALTPYSRNSAWVSKEIEFALDLERKNRVRIIPLYLTTRDTPEALKDHLAIDLRTFSYRAGIHDLADTIHGNLVPGRTPLGRFEQFVSSLPVTDEEVADALDNALVDARFAMSSGDPQRTAEWAERRKATEDLLIRKQLSERDRARILSDLGHIAPALTARELKEVEAWLRVGQPATLAVATQLYADRFVFSPSYRRILKSNIVRQIEGWVGRGELSEEDAPQPNSLIDSLITERLVEPFRREQYVNEPDEDFQEFHAGKWLFSVGKAGYLFAISDPDRPHENYPIGRFPGSTPRPA